MLTIKDDKDGKLITLSKAFDTRAKILNALYFTAFFAMGTYFLRMFWFSIHTTNIMAIAVGSIGLLVCYICAFRFANKASLTEKLFVNKTRLDIIQQGLYNSHTKSFIVSKISGFRHLAKKAEPVHPLSGSTFDYLGFQTQQQVINDMHGENRAAFEYDGKQVTFGNNLYSWEFDELNVLVYDITGDDLRYNEEQEKEFYTNRNDESDLPAQDFE